MKTKANTLKKIKQSLESVVPSEDGRSNIGPLGFLINLIFCYSVDTKKSSLTAIRRSMMSNLKISISNSAFWERLSGKRLNRFLLVVVSTLMAQLSGGMSLGMEMLPSLGVSGIFLVDSCSFSLWGPGAGRSQAHVDAGERARHRRPGRAAPGRVRRPGALRAREARGQRSVPGQGLPRRE